MRKRWQKTTAAVGAVTILFLFETGGTGVVNSVRNAENGFWVDTIWVIIFERLLLSCLHSVNATSSK